MCHYRSCAYLELQPTTLSRLWVSYLGDDAVKMAERSFALAQQERSKAWFSLCAKLFVALKMLVAHFPQEKSGLVANKSVGYIEKG